MTRRDNVALLVSVPTGKPISSPICSKQNVYSNDQSQVVGVTLKVSHICSDELDIVHEDLDDSTDGEGLKEEAPHKIWQEGRSMEV